jgi:hypothetical protein
MKKTKIVKDNKKNKLDKFLDKLMIVLSIIIGIPLFIYFFYGLSILFGRYLF